MLQLQYLKVNVGVSAGFVIRWRHCVWFPAVSCLLWMCVV